MSEPGENLNVIEFPKESLDDVPTMMRKVADQIERGIFGDVKFVTAVMVINDELDTPTFGWGKCSPLECVGALEMGKSNIWHGERE